MKTLFIVLDGAADAGNNTPYERAYKPNLDFLAKNGRCGLVQTVGKGIAPESDFAVMAILGYDPYKYFTGRGPLEAFGAGIKLNKPFLALRTNFATVKNNKITDRRVGRSLTTIEAKELEKEINKKVKLKCKFLFKSTTEHRGVLILYGKFSDEISNVDPAYKKEGAFGVAKAVSSNKIEECIALKKGAENTAGIINDFVRQSIKVLDESKTNERRIKSSLIPANAILPRDAGNKLPKLPKKKKWAAVVGMPLEIGIAELAGMKILKVKYPPITSSKAYEHIYNCLNAEIRDSLKYLKSQWNRFDAFYIHIKETDIPGHDGLPDEKKKMLEIIDKKLFSEIRKLNARIIVTSDHATPCELKSHSDGLVPLLVYDGKRKDKISGFSEKECAKGSLGILLGKDILKKV
ncbi:MAG: alkaline phosphatase family protein [Candidatus Nanoarchaeia archaeon]|nr:alkaline phosphatase family protein [Candidatus Nanoarchaeia archaeon]